jgi:cell division protease FtsH
MANQNNQQNNQNQNNNFFNNNPLITFALFSVIMILIFKSLVGDSSDLRGSVGPNVRIKEINY